MSLTAENQEVLKQSNVPDFQIILKSNQNTHSLRDLTAEHVNSLIKVPGIVISCSKARSKAVEVVIRCTKCRNTKSLSCKAAMVSGDIIDFLYLFILFSNRVVSKFLQNVIEVELQGKIVVQILT
jgi:DNA replicative helicase MCM subunit Mcm2 (Cdc46/Mcm family)